MVRDYLIMHFFFPARKENECSFLEFSEKAVVIGVVMKRELLEKGQVWALLVAEREFFGAAGCASPAPPSACSLGQKMQACYKKGTL